jgi:hypothetical protein
MAVLKKGDIKSPALPKETVQVDVLGGEVVVKGLLMTERIALFQKHEGATIAQMLAMTVIDGEGKQLFNEQEWDVFGATHFAASLELFKVAKRLSGLDAEVEAKNS